MRKTNERELQTEGLIRLDRMYESLRYNNYSIEGGLGEIVDNAIEAGSANITVILTVEKNKRKSDIVEIAIIDDGCGMKYDVLYKCLVLGESMQPFKNEKRGIGRFGVGMTLGSISLARRVEVYSRAHTHENFIFTFIDLDDIQSRRLVHIPQPIAKQPDEKYAKYLEGQSGTIVVLKNCDRITGDRDKLANYLGRTYRKFIEAGVNITLDGEKIHLHDPLYISGPTVFDTKGMVDHKAELLGEEKISLPIPETNQNADVTIRMSLLPKEWRLTRGSGGSDEAKKRKIEQNEGVSILRADREVLYGYVPYIIGVKGTAAALDIDRWWGCEISFPPELDDYFQVRYIKRGAEPIPSLRDKIREKIMASVKAARERVKRDWANYEKNEYKGAYDKAEDTMAKLDNKLPRSKKGFEISKEDAERKVDEAADNHPSPEDRDKRRKEYRAKPYIIRTVDYPQNIFFETEHLLGKTIVALNVNHPFYKQVILPLCGSLNDEINGGESNGKNDVKDAILLLLFAYAKAEAMFPDSDDFFNGLRTQWGTILSAAINQYKK